MSSSTLHDTKGQCHVEWFAYTLDALKQQVQKAQSLEDGHGGVNQCVPDKKYVFQIESPASEECCGFDPTNFVVYYDGEVVRKSDWMLKMKLNPPNRVVERLTMALAHHLPTANDGMSQAFTVEAQTFFGGRGRRWTMSLCYEANDSIKCNSEERIHLLENSSGILYT